MPAVDSLLATKLYIPAPRPHRVPRPRLTARIAAGAAGPLTLISAPAGFGKSTLLSDWAHEGGRRVAWVSLDAAFENARQAVHLGRRGGIGDGLLSGYVVSMRILTARGDFAGAFEALERAEEVVRRTGQPRWLATIEAFRARLHLRRFRLIASGLSNAEAGRRLFIAPSTVKKHLENIYEKLGTRRRTAAIARAREPGVL